MEIKKATTAELIDMLRLSFDTFDAPYISKYGRDIWKAILQELLKRNQKEFEENT